MVRLVLWGLLTLATAGILAVAIFIVARAVAAALLVTLLIGVFYLALKFLFSRITSRG